MTPTSLLAPATLLVTRSLTSSNDSDRSTKDTIEQMYRIVREYVNNYDVQQATKQALVGLANPTSRQIISKVFYFIKNHIKFTLDHVNTSKILPDVQDPTDVELLITPDLVLKLKTGDCDCFSMLASAMLRVAGINTRFITVAADKSAPWVFSHVYLEAFDSNNQVWIPVDVSHGNSPDWEFKGITRRYTWID